MIFSSITYECNIENLLLMTKRLCVDKKKRIAVALDVDNTLVYTSEEEIADYDFTINSASQTQYFVKLRPGLKRFLNFCQKNCQVFIYSAANIEYIHEILKGIFSKLYSSNSDKIEIKRIFSRNDCFQLIDWHDKIIYKKDLNRLQCKHAYLIDDLPESFFDRQKANGILIKPYFGDDENENEFERIIEIINSKIDNICHQSLYQLTSLKAK
ncbi:hypothetical protein TRFO_30895 [Tritrichomonas foetus]|uniref:Mitochondrial import inner membrane translocase subunit TIM50 n=1 Tax=Tritrichomonas foetus TaxID=1144522 RepID=A0A1J4JXY7_9EUKA|nr:hypothetical protein TRFO_30895 [Tritrichomonas foetus]|eukprot:OHT02133.1 hypothetical protein TRFO_30895 [Tritrichomonas foetus]